MPRLLRTIVVYVVINLGTFAIDLGLLSLTHGLWGWPLPVSVTAAYALAFAISFVLNRRFNFHSHAPVGSQVVRYVVVVVLNYLVLLLGLTNLLAFSGVQYQVARIAAGLCEAVFVFCAMRWFVFRPSAVERAAAARAAERAGA